MNQDFQQELESLNPEQLQAVNHIYGAILLTAGAGAGKTRVLTLRIANILKQTDVSPKNILALTFTDSATKEMQERLAGLIGAEAYDVNIFTFHGFANMLIAEYSEVFGFRGQYQAIDELKSYLILKGILENGKYKEIKSFFDPLQNLKEVKGNISSLKREKVSADDYLELIKQEEDQFAAIDESDLINPKTGKIKDKYKKIQKKISKNREFLDVYIAYNKYLSENLLYDYDDMILFVLDAMERNDGFLYDLKERFLFVLIDEFQDTNTSQLKLAENLLDQEQPNIFAVGDADQSIYRFQGASISNILFFKNHFPDSHIIPLNTNYRSSQEIIDVSNSLILNNSQRITNYIQDFDFKLRSHKGANGKKPLVFEFTDTQEERCFLVSKIKELKEKGVNAEDIAILVTRNNDGFQLQNLLEQQQIPASFSGNSNALENIYLRQFLDLLRLIKSPNKQLFFKVLHFDFLKVDVVDLYKLFDDIGDIYDFFKSYEKDDHMGKMIQLIMTWQKDLYNMSVVDFMRKVFNESGLLAYLSNYDALKTEDLESVNALFLDAEKLFYQEGKESLDDFFENIILREKFGIALGGAGFSLQKHKVNILTVHKAKGLEFEYVFIPSVNKNIWNGRVNRKSISLFNVIQDTDEDKEEEERRLFYVALTRAKTRLYLSCTQERQKSKFLEELGKDQTEVRGFDITPQQKIQNTFSFKKPDSKRDEYIKNKLESGRFAISHTLFENYKICPRKCFYENIVHSPRKKPKMMILGVAIHAALERYFLDIKSKKTPSVSEAVFAMRNAIDRELISKDEKKEIQAESEEILVSYLESQRGYFADVAEVEYDFRYQNVMLFGEIPLTGKIDKLEYIDPLTKRVRLVDYKASRPKSANDIMGLNKDDDLYKGKNYRQMIFFGLLADLSGNFPYGIDSFDLHFLKPKNGDYKNVSLIVQDQQKEELKEELREVWAKIKNLEFPKLEKEQKQKICMKIESKSRCPFYEICWQEKEPPEEAFL